GQRAEVVGGSGVDTSYFSSGVPPESHNPPRFLMVGRILESKGVWEYLAAARKVKESFPAVSFSYAGWFDKENPDAIGEEDFRSVAEESGVEFLGKIGNVREVLDEHSVFVLPSYREGLPRSTIEALSMGRPIITTAAPGCRETVVDGWNGFMVPVGDPNALANAMIKVVEGAGPLIAAFGR